MSAGGAPLYPLFLKVAGARAVVVGGGPVGLHKASELAAAGARVTVVAPELKGALPAGAEHLGRVFETGDTRGALVVIAATGLSDVDDAVAADAKANGALVNAVDRAEISGFYSGATVRRGPVVVAVGTSGASPALARKVRERIDQVLPQSLGVLAQVLGEVRPRLLERFPSITERARVLDTFVERAWFRFAAGPSRYDNDHDTKAAIARAIEEELLS